MEVQPPSSDKVDSTSEVNSELEFPRGPCKHGNVYSMDTPYDQRIVIMSEPTWVDIGTRLEEAAQMMRKQDVRIKELLAENAVAQQVASDAVTRLENIRHARREELRARIEPEVHKLLTADDPKFVVPSKRKN